MTREEALELIETKWWVDKTDRQIVEFQLYERRLCLPFDLFHAALEKALGRSVWTHEMANMELLQAEFEGHRESPSMEEILEQIPADKRIVFEVDPSKHSE